MQFVAFVFHAAGSIISFALFMFAHDSIPGIFVITSLINASEMHFIAFVVPTLTNSIIFTSLNK